MDSGTTTLEIARPLKNIPHVQVMIKRGLALDNAVFSSTQRLGYA
jgi:hypothetical protein